jgi:uncharacterized lipoprotein YmbA
MRKWLTILFPLFLMGACAMPETRVYSLYLPLGRGNTTYPKGDASIVIRINSPRYLTQPYIVYRKSPYQLEISRYSKWEVSPNDILCEAFQDALSSIPRFKEVRVMNIVPDGFYLLMINLKKFERSDAENDSFGELMFDVQLLSPDGEELYQDRISKRTKLEDRSFLSLAKGLSGALAEGVEGVRDHIDRSLKGNKF